MPHYQVTLTRTLPTPIGVYPAGLTVRVVGVPSQGLVRLCLDPAGRHLTGRCHTVTMARALVRPKRGA